MENIITVSDQWPHHHKIWSGAELVAMAAHESGHIITLPTDYVNIAYLSTVSAPLRKWREIFANIPLDVVCWFSLLFKFLRYKPKKIRLHGHYLYIPTIVLSKILGITVDYYVADYFPFCPRTYLTCVKGHSSKCGGCKSKYKLIPVISHALMWVRSVIFNWANRQINMVALTKTCQARLKDFGIDSRVEYPFKLPVIHEGMAVKRPAIFYGGSLSEENGYPILKESMRDGWNLYVAHGMSRESAVSLMNACDLVCIPYQWPKDFGPMVLKEAVALKKKILVSDLGSARELVGEESLVKNYSSVEEWRERIAECLNWH